MFVWPLGSQGPSATWPFGSEWPSTSWPVGMAQSERSPHRSRAPQGRSTSNLQIRNTATVKEMFSFNLILTSYVVFSLEKYEHHFWNKLNKVIPKNYVNFRIIFINMMLHQHEKLHTGHTTCKKAKQSTETMPTCLTNVYWIFRTVQKSTNHE